MTRRSSAALALPSLFDSPSHAPVPVPTHQVRVRAHRRTVRGVAGPSGTALRDAALDTLERDTSLTIARAYVRAQLAALYRQRAIAWAHKPERICVNADDVAEILDSWPDYPADVRARPGHWKGSLFRGGWVQTGTSTCSVRPHMHATQLPNWRLVEGDA